MGQTKQRSTTNVFPTALLVVVMALAMIFATPPQATLSAHAEGTTVDLSTLTENYTAQDGDTLTGTLDGDERPYSISIADGATVTPKNAIINGGTVYAKGKYDSGEAVPYLAWDESSQSVKSVAGGCATYTVVASDTTVWGVAGTETWYVVSNDTTINSRVVANGTVNLILCDGATLTVPGGIQVTTNNTLSIFEQAESTGAILINGVGDDNAGIGGARNARGGTINIHGGTITVSGGGYGAGIGGGYRTAGGNITIYGGTITVSGGRSAAGIGGGYREAGGNTTIYGGTVTANGGNPYGAGIGGGFLAAGGNTTIYGGVVTATGYNASGIGGGSDGKGGTVTIHGGKITANGGTYSPGIGGKDGYSGVVTINGGYVVANGGDPRGAGIGGGDGTPGATVTINGGYVVANGNKGSAGIGGADSNGSDNGTLTVSNATVLTNGNDTTSDLSIRTENMVVKSHVPYMAWNGTQLTENNLKDKNYTILENNITTLSSDSWYVVLYDVTVSERVMASGTVNLVLCDGVTLTAAKGITLNGATLNIYAQKEGTGALIVNKVEENNVGIGGEGGAVNVHGGNVKVTGGANGAGIGNLTVYGGDVTANGGENAVAFEGTLAVNNGLSVVSGTTVIERIQGNYERSASMRVYRLPTITYHVNGGTINDGAVSSYIEGVGATLPADVIREGYLFLGWFGNEGLTGDPITAIGTDATGDKTFWAKWKYDLKGVYDACEAGGTIVLPVDVDLSDEADDFLIVEKSITIDLNGHILNITSDIAGDKYKIRVMNGAVLTIDDTSGNVGGVIGVCATYPTQGSYLVLRNCRMTYSAAQIIAAAQVNHIADGSIIEDIPNAPDANGFVSIVRPKVDQDYADVVIELIGAIGQVEYTTESKEKIDEAREAYDALTNSQKALVTNYAVLTADEDFYATLKTNHEAADVVIAKIAAIGEVEYTEECKGKIDEARAAYNALPDEAKTLVTNFNGLDEAETLYAGYMTNAINGLPGSDGITTADKDAIEAARAAYDALTDEEKAKVAPETLAKLEAAESALAVATATEEINDLPGSDEITTADKDAIEAARAAYEALSGEEKAKISPETLAKLEEAESALEVSAVSEEINDLPSSDKITTADKETIKAARAAYEALSDEEKAKVAPETLAKLEAAESALSVATATEEINGLPGSDEITTADKETIKAARAAYEALSDEEKAKVAPETLAKLEAAESALSVVTATEEINGLPGSDEITTADKEAIEAARAAYDALTDEEKAKVAPETLAKLEAAESALEVSAVSEEIDDLPGSDEITTADKDTIEAARAAYEALSGEEKAKVAPETLAKLEEAESALAVSTANESIDALPSSDEITTADKEAIEAARAAYDALTDEEKAKVAPETLAKLEAAESALEVSAVSEAIDKLPSSDEITTADKEAIEAAREAYEALSDEQKAKVDPETLTKLKKAESALEVSTVSEAIDELPSSDEITTADKETIKAAREAYEALSDEQKAKVDPETLAKLEAAERMCKAKEVEAIIDNIGTVEYDEASKARIEEARAAYDALSTEEKALVGNANDLTTAESTYVRLENNAKAAEVIALIESIGNVEYTSQSYEAIEAARAAYNALTPEQKALVDNYNVLTAAESTYEQKVIEATAGVPGGIIAWLVILIIAIIVASCFFVMLLMQYIKNKKQVKMKSTAIGLPLLAAVSAATKSVSIALYVLIGVFALIVIADVVLFLMNKKVKEAAQQEAGKKAEGEQEKQGAQGPEYVTTVEQEPAREEAVENDFEEETN